MAPTVGDIIYHQITNEAGRIVRLVEIDGGAAYVVATNNRMSGTETEALWRTFEVKASNTRDGPDKLDRLNKEDA